MGFPSYSGRRRPDGDRPRGDRALADEDAAAGGVEASDAPADRDLLRRSACAQEGRRDDTAVRPHGRRPVPQPDGGAARVADERDLAQAVAPVAGAEPPRRPVERPRLGRRQPPFAEAADGDARCGELDRRRPGRQLEVQEARCERADVLARHVADVDHGERVRVPAGAHLAPFDPARQVRPGVDRRHLDDANGVGQALDGQGDPEHPAAVHRLGSSPQRPRGGERAAVERDRLDALRATAGERRTRGGDDGRPRHGVVPRHPPVVDERLGDDRPVDGLCPALPPAASVYPPGAERGRERLAGPGADHLGDAQHLSVTAERGERPRLDVDVDGRRGEGQCQHDRDGEDDRHREAGRGDAEP
jgi:hypothetical protein